MGFHICEYCPEGACPRFSQYSSGDTTMSFEGGGTYEVPDMILHYIADHGWAPPAEFIKDVMERKLRLVSRMQTKGAAQRIGYLAGHFETGEVPPGFVEKLESLMVMADLAGGRLQFRGGGR